MRTPEIFMSCTICPAACLPGTAAISCSFPICQRTSAPARWLTFPSPTLQYQVLSFVSTHPKAGRLAIKNGLADGETFVSEAALRTVLGELSSAGYLIVHRTKGGCEISELGRMVLEK